MPDAVAPRDTLEAFAGVWPMEEKAEELLALDEAVGVYGSETRSTCSKRCQDAIPAVAVADADEPVLADVDV